MNYYFKYNQNARFPYVLGWLLGAGCWLLLADCTSLLLSQLIQLVDLIEQLLLLLLLLLASHALHLLLLCELILSNLLLVTEHLLLLNWLLNE